MGLAGNRPGTGGSEDLAAQVLLSLALKEAVPKHDLYSHPMFSTPRFMPFRSADWPLVSPFLNPITHASFETVAPEMEPFFLRLTDSGKNRVLGSVQFEVKNRRGARVRRLHGPRQIPRAAEVRGSSG
jgi:hypothetical protein